jgi:hypothetical protein
LDYDITQENRGSCESSSACFSPRHSRAECRLPGASSPGLQ